MDFRCTGARRRRCATTRRTIASKVLALLTGAFVLVTAAACDTQHNAAPPPERGTLHIGVQSLIDNAPLYIAQDKQLFRGTGLHVQLVPESSDQAAIEALRTGQVDVAFGSDVNLLKAAAGGTKLRIQAEAYQASSGTMALVLPKQAQYTNLGSIPQPTVAVHERNGLGTLATKARLQTIGVDPARVHFVTMPFKDMAGALQHGKVTAAFMEEPYLTQTERSTGAYSLDAARGGLANLPLSSYAAMAKFSQQNPRTMRVFRQVLRRAQAMAADRHEVQRVLPEYSSVDATTAALVSTGTFPTALSTVRLQRVADNMQTAGLLSTRLDVLPLVPPSMRS